MTEQATLNIMDLVEEIRGDYRTVQVRLLNLAASQTSEGTEEDTPASGFDEAGGQGLWDQVFSQAEELDRCCALRARKNPSRTRECPIFPLPRFSRFSWNFAPMKR